MPTSEIQNFVSVGNCEEKLWNLFCVVLLCFEIIHTFMDSKLNPFSARVIILAFRPLIQRKCTKCMCMSSPYAGHSPSFPACLEIMGQSPNPTVSSVLVSEDSLRASFAINHILKENCNAKTS